MAIESALYLMLTQAPTLAAVLGGRVYPIRLPQEPVLPAVAYQLVNGNSDYSLSGDSQYRTALMQVSVMAADFDSCLDASEKVIQALSALRGSYAGIDVQFVKQTNAIDIPEDEPHENPIFHRAIDFEITYLTTGPDP